MTMDKPLSAEERRTLLRLARLTLEASVCNRPLPELDLAELTPRLRQDGASFVTLTQFGDLRGCVGALEAHQPLAEDVKEHAIAAALQDFRFPPVQPGELPQLQIEISCLTPPQELEYENANDLIRKLRPHIDGVTLFDGWRRATFLPQVWDKLPDAADFLNHLCQKMGAAPDLWRRRALRVQIYQVEEFSE